MSRGKKLEVSINIMLYRQIGYFFWGLSLSQNNKVGMVVGG